MHSQKLEQNFENLSGFSLRNSFWNNLLEFQNSKEDFETSVTRFKMLPENEQRTWFDKASQWSRRTRVQDEWQKYYFVVVKKTFDEIIDGVCFFYF